MREGREGKERKRSEKEYASFLHVWKKCGKRKEKNIIYLI